MKARSPWRSPPWHALPRFRVEKTNPLIPFPIQTLFISTPARIQGRKPAVALAIAEQRCGIEVSVRALIF